MAGVAPRCRGEGIGLVYLGSCPDEKVRRRRTIRVVPRVVSRPCRGGIFCCKTRQGRATSRACLISPLNTARLDILDQCGRCRRHESKSQKSEKWGVMRLLRQAQPVAPKEGMGGMTRRIRGAGPPPRSTLRLGSG